MMRVLSVVGRSFRISPDVSISDCCIKVRIRSPAKSRPITPIETGVPSSAFILAATLPDPPRRYVSFVTSTTGTGASGEIRRTFPQMNSSSMTSPRMRMVLPEKRCRICSTLVRFMFNGLFYGLFFESSCFRGSHPTTPQPQHSPAQPSPIRYKAASRRPGNDSPDKDCTQTDSGQRGVRCSTAASAWSPKNPKLQPPVYRQHWQGAWVPNRFRHKGGRHESAPRVREL